MVRVLVVDDEPQLLRALRINLSARRYEVIVAADGASALEVAARHIPIYACGACSRARGVTEADLSNYGAKYGNPAIFVSLVEWADKVITE